ncbi:thioredoxin domain-containing protein [Streptococcus hyovaginalis]|uniref:thioredoxin domain-containing protein n=1 Tax=Streptococcus hyovaginalis TaxID=149015 RepID=UPI002A90EB4B|nr:thioredoxin domain-containing protein [Streptococcus hyovaginalis]MDY5974158.1 thioredoxin domain-containing protein [Streptococcus hyovaginalis]
MFNTNDFFEDIKDFTVVNPQEARELLEAKEGAVIFFGRDTCPYCRRFAPKLATAATSQNWTVHFLHTQKPAYSAQEIAELRDQYQVPTVPGLLHAKADGVQVRCDSSLSVEEIIDFINA